MTRMSVAQAKQLGILDKPKKHKYGAIRTIVDGIPFDSKKEAVKYQELKLLKMAGEIVELELQPEFVLQEAYIRHGKPIKAIVYRADFRAKYKDGRVVVMDTKGFRTKEYLLKKKLLLARYPDIEFVEC
ncbi:DUF1064 domain-containing protein [Sporomusa paucivorans]|uniref:DUF1064 domain-containing protein n=1 Tax=Sporomusa paucivorans TaxID=2376 RepID=UPI003570F635